MGLRVIHPGPGATVQDEGRFGYREWGVPVGGAFDRGAAGLANALVGNAPGLAVLELTLVGGTYEAEAPLALALAGAPLEASVSGRAGRRPLRIPQSFALAAGERLVLGGSSTGARCYLAVRGGWQTPVVLGSRSREERLRAGAVLPAGSGTTPSRRPADDLWQDPSATPLRIIDGPDAGPDVQSWDTVAWRVGRESDRMGLRLEGATIPASPALERTSAPLAPGAIQLAGAHPMILGAACGTMGGYPHVAHVISADLDRVGQLRPGDTVRFRRVTLAEARALDTRARSDLTRRLRQIATLAAGD